MLRCNKIIVVLLSLFCIVSTHADDITIVTEDASSVKFLYGCEVFDQAGTYVVDYDGVGGTRTLNLTILQRSSMDDQVATIKLGETILFGCRMLKPVETGTKVYFDTVPEIGYDRIFKLTLTTVEPEPEECDTMRFAYTDSIVEGETYLFGCQYLKTEGTYVERLTGAASNGCDSIVTLTLKYYEPAVEPEECDTMRFAYTDSIVEGETYLFGCQYLKTEGTYVERLTGAASNGCDSIVTLTLKYYEPAVEPEECDTMRFAYTDSIVEGETYLFGCQYLTTEGTYVERLTGVASNGCDSIVTLTLKYYEPAVEPEECDTMRFAYTDSIVEGETYLFGCQYLKTEGTYVERLTGAASNGCDSIVTLTLKYYEPVVEPEECDTMRFAYTDSIVEGETYLFGCQYLKTEGTYVERLTGAASNGCDSIVTLTLKFSVPVLGPGDCEVVYSIYTDSIVEGETYLFGCQYLTTEGEYEERLHGAAQNGCDSIVLLTLKFYEPEPYDSVRAYIYDTVNYTACAGYTYTTYSGQITVQNDTTVNDTIADYLGMYIDEVNHQRIYTDSVVTYSLSVWQPTDSVLQDSIELGQTYSFKGEEIVPIETGIVYLYDTLPGENMYGCDSTIMIELKVVKVDTLRDEVSVEMDSALCVGSTFELGDMEWVIRHDTVVKDTLSRIHEQKDLVMHTLTYIDSVTIFNLRVWEQRDTTLQDSIELGDTYTFKGEIYTPEEAGILLFFDTVPNMHGCDSVITTELRVINVDTLREYVEGAMDSALCAGSIFEIGQKDLVINEDTTVLDTISGAREVKNPVLHTLTYIDSVTTYNLVAWQSVDSMRVDSIELGQQYEFKGEILVPETADTINLLDTLFNSFGCDSVLITLELRVIKVDTLHEYVQGVMLDTVCAGGIYTAGSKMFVVDRDTVVTDTVFALLEEKDDALHTLTYTDSVTTYTILTWHESLDIDVELDWGYAFCGTSYTGDTVVLAVVREAITADDLFQKDTLLSLLYKDETGVYVSYAGGAMSPEMDEIALRIEITNACVTIQIDTTLAVIPPDYEKSDVFDDMPAVSRYNDWLLMVNLDSLNKVYNLYPEPDSVRWYRMTGPQPDIMTDELVGTGYYYTDDRHLVGSYYAIVTLPEQTDACGGSWRTRIVVRTSDSEPLLAPSVVRPGETMMLYHLHASGDVRIYNVGGVCVDVLRFEADEADENGTLPVQTDALPAGVYMLHVDNGIDRTVIPFILRE